MVGFDQPPIAQLVYDTEKCQYTQRSDKRRQLGQIVKRWNKPQPSNPHEQHQNTLPTRQSRIIPAIADTRRINIHLFRQLAGNQISGNSHGYNGRQEHGTRKTGRCDRSLDPQHQSRHIADYRKTTSGIGRNYNDRPIIHAETTPRQQLTHDGKHHQSRGQVVEIGRQDIGYESHHPQKTLTITGRNPLADEIKATVRIQQIDNRHRSQKVKHDLTNIRYVTDKNIIGNKILKRSDVRGISA